MLVVMYYLLVRDVSPKVRLFLLELYDFQCLSCYSKHRLTIDHVVPKSLGGSSSVNNLQILCWKCNVVVKHNSMIDFRKGISAKMFNDVFNQ